MPLADLLGLLSVPGLKPPRGQHWTWWALWSVWAGFWLMILALTAYVVVTWFLN
jgi:hypothetical protein